MVLLANTDFNKYIINFLYYFYFFKFKGQFQIGSGKNNIVFTLQI